MVKRTIPAVCLCLVIAGAAVVVKRQVDAANVPEIRLVQGKVLPTDAETVIYSHAGGQTLRLDLYRPEKTHLGAAILMLHGGGWVGGDRRLMADMADRAAKMGYVVASADYRLAPTTRWPAQLEDAQTAVRYLRANAKALNIDPENIAAVGVSAGGQLSLFLGSVEAKNPDEYKGLSSRVAVVGSISGLHDLRLKMTPKGEQFGIIQALTGSREGPAVDEASPIFSLSKGSAPTYFIQGAVDPLVPPDQTEQASKRLSALGVQEKAVTVPGMGHGMTFVAKNQIAAFDDMLVWIHRHLPHGQQ